MSAASSTTMSPIDEAKKKAAYAAVDEFIKDNHRVGVGSGSTVVFAVQRLAQRVHEEGLKVQCCVPSSFQARQLIVQHKLPLSDLEMYPELDIVIDGADEVDNDLNLIKGGGACQTQEKLLAACSKCLVICADYTKESNGLGQKWKKGVPIEVLPLAYVPVMKQLEKLGGKPTLRMAVNKAGPVVTDNAGFVIDCTFPSIDNPAELELSIRSIVGVVCTGLFVGMAHKAFFGQADGSVTTRVRKN